MTSQPASAPPTPPTPSPSPSPPVLSAGGPLRAPGGRRRGKRKRLVLLVAVGFLVAGAGAAKLLLPGLHPSRPDLVLHTVKRETIVQAIVERGDIESADNHDIYNRVNHEALAGYSKTNIKWVIDDGSYAKKGDTLMVLDSSKLEDVLRTQGMTRDKAENDYIFAKATLEVTLKDNATKLGQAERAVEVARLSLQEYRDGTYPRDLKDVNARILTNEADLEQNKDYTAYVDRMVNKKFMPYSQAQAAHAKLLGSDLNLKKEEENKRVLVEYTYPKTIKDLQGKLDDAQSDLDAKRISTAAQERKDNNDLKTKEEIFKQEQKKYDQIKAEIAKCVIRAEKDGLVVYYLSPQARRGAGQSQGIIAEGEQVFLGQKLMQMPDLKHMLVNTRIHETLVSQVKPGQRALLRPHSFPGQVLEGKVKTVANVAMQQDWYSSDVKVYEVLIEIEDPIPGLKPGMSAEVTIFTDIRAKAVLAVPVQAIVRVPGTERKYKVFVKTDAGMEEKEVTVGISNEKMVAIKSGLSEGDEVILNVDVLQGETKGKDTDDPKASPGSPGGAKDKPGGGSSGSSGKQASPGSRGAPGH